MAIMQCANLLHATRLKFGQLHWGNLIWSYDKSDNKLYGCIVWNAHNTVFISKHSAISNTWFLGPTRVLNASAISIASVVF